MPDIDIDFCINDDKVIDYIKDKYGHDCSTNYHFWNYES